MDRKLERLFSPRSVAVIGATESANKPGRIVVQQLLDAGIEVYPVNPTKDQVLGVSVYKAVSDVPLTPDVAVVAVSAAAAVPAVEECVRVGIAFVIVLAGGFGETDETGKALELRLTKAIAGTNTRLLGPNTLGVQIPASGFDTVFVDHAVGALASRGRAAGLGSVVFVSQSGSVGVEALGAASLHGLPLRAFVGLGNAVDLQALDFVTHVEETEGVSALALYLEHLGEGRPLLEAARNVARRLPVFVLKAGRTAAGAAAVASHTGRLAGSDAVVDGALSQFAIQRVADDEELMDAVRAVSYASAPAGNRVAIVTSAGGYGVMGADYIEANMGMRTLGLASLDAGTEEALRSAVLPFASTHNPVDLTAGADTKGFLEAVDIVLADHNVDILIAYAFFAPAAIGDDLVEGLAESAKKSDKTILVFAHFGAQTDEYCRRLTEVGLAAYPALDRVIRAARILVERSMLLRRQAAADYNFEAGNNSEAGNYSTAERGGGVGAVLQPSGPLGEAETKALLETYGVATPPRLVLAPEATVSMPAFPGPYVVKASAPGLLHKTESGAVRLAVTEGQLPKVVDEFRRRFSDASIFVEQMIGDIDLELIVGAIRDGDLGPAIMVGAGGVRAELYRDTSFRLIPAPRSELLAMTGELMIAPFFAGFRGVSVDREALVDLLLKVSECVINLGGAFSELDINPLAFAGGRWITLDAKLTLES